MPVGNILKSARLTQEQAGHKEVARMNEVSQDISQKIPVWRGPFNVNCTSNKEPGILMSEIARALETMKVAYHK